jgi:hypothetical protein
VANGQVERMNRTIKRSHRQAQSLRQPTKYELVIILKTAKAFGVIVSPNRSLGDCIISRLLLPAEAIIEQKSGTRTA